jgi:hypothetical protein
MSQRSSQSFTVHNSSEIDAKVMADLDLIKESLIHRFSGLRGLILVGGFGRGEGSVLIDKGQIVAVNDYDIIVVSQQPLDPDELLERAQETAELLGIWHVDLVGLSESAIDRLPFTMFNCDAKHGGYVFWGDKKLLDRFPARDPAKMPLEEARLLLFNRISTLLECMDESYLGRKPEGDARFFLLNQVSRVVLAACDSRLIMAGRYHHSYREKRARFLNLGRPVLESQLVAMAAGFKLTPSMTVSWDALDYWFSSRDMFQSTLCDLMERLTGEPVGDWIDFARIHRAQRQRRTGVSFLKAALAEVVRPPGENPSRDRETADSLLNLQLSALLLSFALERAGVDGRLVRAARERLQPEAPVALEMEWEPLVHWVIEQLHLVHGFKAPPCEAPERQDAGVEVQP